MLEVLEDEKAEAAEDAEDAQGLEGSEGWSRRDFVAGIIITSIKSELLQTAEDTEDVVQLCHRGFIREMRL